MEVSKSDLTTTVRYLMDAAKFLDKERSIRWQDRARLMRRLAKKLNKKIDETYRR